MKTRIPLVSMVAFAVLLAGAGAIAAPPMDAKTDTTTKAKIGEPAPDFMLKDAAGKAYKLSDYKGKIVVLQWINPDCPVCRRVSSSGLVTKMEADLKKLDPNIVHLAINSTHYMAPEKSAPYLKENKVDAPALIDQDGTVGHLYGARTTPHMFVIDEKGILRYSGAFDDDQRGAKGADATNYVINAVTQIKAGETVAPDTTKPYGCGVKYARGNGSKGGWGKGKGQRSDG